MQGAAVYFYLFALDKYDASNVSGFENFYPVLVTVLSMAFLGERIDLYGYLGIGLSTVGAVAISLNLTKVRIPFLTDFINRHTSHATRGPRWIERKNFSLRNDNVECWTPLSLCRKSDDGSGDTGTSETERLCSEQETQEQVICSERQEGAAGASEQGGDWDDDNKNTKVPAQPRWLPLAIMVPLIVCVALNVVFTKVAVSDLNSNSVAAINFVSFGVLLMFSLVVRASRENFAAETKRNWLFAFVSQLLTCSSLYLIVIAVGRIDASITSAMNCLQPVTVLVLERVLKFSDDSWAECISYKLLPILFIAVGVALLACSVLS